MGKEFKKVLIQFPNDAWELKGFEMFMTCLKSNPGTSINGLYERIYYVPDIWSKMLIRRRIKFKQLTEKQAQQIINLARKKRP